MFSYFSRIGSLGLIVPLVAVGAAACASVGVDDAERSNEDVITSADKVQMNDVSVLFPIANSPEEAEGYLAPWSDGLGGKLFPESVYRAATGEGESSKVGHPIEAGPHPSDVAPLDYGNMRAVAFRIDPCFAAVGPMTSPETCQNQLRIVFQSLVLDHEGPAASDNGLHAFYSLTREELLAFLDEERALRREQAQGDDDLGPLAVHPLLAKQGLLGPYAKGLTALVSKFVGEKNLTRFTVLTIAPNGVPVWTFRGFDVDASGQTSKMLIPTIAPPPVDDPILAPLFLPTETRFAAGDVSTAGLVQTNSNGTTSPDDVSLLFDVDSARAAPLKDQQKAVDAALRIMNPNFHSPNTIDCASCHIAEQAVTLTGGALGFSTAGNPNAFVPDPAFVSVANMQQTAPMPVNLGADLHLFSYMQRTPTIAQRVINETAAVATYLNGTVLPNR